VNAAGGEPGATLRRLGERARTRLRWLVGLPQLEAQVTHLTQRVRDLEARALRAEALADAHHETRLMANHATTVAAESLAIGRRLDEHVQRLVNATFDMERWAEIEAVTRWIAATDPPESLLISVVMPTRDRAELLPEAIESVSAQDYGRWELIVVDDGSTDATPKVLDEAQVADGRISVLRTSGVGASEARNRALDEAVTGDVIVYLDDDNLLHPMWLKAVAWAFTNLPDTQVLYGARLVDDWNRVREIDEPGLPALHFERYDADILAERNQVDMGAIAHRPSTARFDAELRQYGDWDLFLQLTADGPPLELPVIALLYRSRIDGRLSDEGTNDAEVDHVHRRHAERVDDGG
jgi:hypothetical protein